LIGWHDYGILQNKLPVSIQVFQVWWYSLNEDKLAPDSPLDIYRKEFPDIEKDDRAEQKRRLRRKIEKYRDNKNLLADPRTEK
jgi:hypothetical protein